MTQFYGTGCRSTRRSGHLSPNSSTKMKARNNPQSNKLNMSLNNTPHSFEKTPDSKDSRKQSVSKLDVTITKASLRSRSRGNEAMRSACENTASHSRSTRKAHSQSSSADKENKCETPLVKRGRGRPKKKLTNTGSTEKRKSGRSINFGTPVEKPLKHHNAKASAKSSKGKEQQRKKRQTLLNKSQPTEKTMTPKLVDMTTNNEDSFTSRFDYSKRAHKELFDWVIKPVPDNRGICVEGQLKGQEYYWHSTVIAEAREPKVVVTATGSVYILKGKINKLCTIDNGISQDVAEAFKNGFPGDWKEIIQNYYDQLETSITITEECMTPKRFKQLKSRQKVAAARMKSFTEEETDLVVCPAGLLMKDISTTQLPVTRSGRLSLPPLADWAGQRYALEPSGNISVTFNTNTARQAFHKETIDLLKCQNIKRELKHFSLSKSLNASPSFTSIMTKTPTSSINRQGTSKSLDRPVHSKKAIANAKKSNKKVQGSSNKKVTTVQSTNMTPFKDETYQPSVHLVDVSQTKTKKMNKKNGVTASLTSPQTAVTDANNLLINCGTKDQSNNKRKKQTKSKKVSAKQKSVAKDSQAAKRVKCTDSQNDSFSNEAAKKNEVKAVGKSRGKRKNTEMENSLSQSLNADTSRMPKKRKLNSGVDENGWNQQEKEDFKRALADLDGDTEEFWFCVSQRVGSKNEEECLQYHKACLEQSAKEAKPSNQAIKQKKNQTGREKGGAIRGTKGTLKRKQDIRDFIDEQNEGYEDDLFDATPFGKLKKNSRLPGLSINFNKTDSDIFGTNHNFFTPMAGRNPFDTPSVRLNAHLASVRKTPMNQTAAPAFGVTPLSVNNRKHDIYIKNFMEKKKWTRIPQEEEIEQPAFKAQSSLNESVLPLKALFPGTSPSIHLDEADESNDEDDDDGNRFTYYWSDGD